MSLELLLLIAIFVLLPLLQQLLSVVRQRDERAPDRAGTPVASERQPAMEERLPAAHAPLRRPPEDRQLPATARQQSSEPMTASERMPARSAATSVVADPAVLRRGRRNRAVASLHNPPGLRRAFVLMTILGPCRAGPR
jgi:hypothetical protein